MAVSVDEAELGSRWSPGIEAELGSQRSPKAELGHFSWISKESLIES